MATSPGPCFRLPRRLIPARLPALAAGVVLALGLVLAGVRPAAAQTAGVQIQQNDAVITSIGPATVGPGSSIDIQGTGFSGSWFTTSTVLFNGVPAISFTVVSPTEIIAVLPNIPAGWVNVSITLSNGNGSVYGPGVVDPWNTGPPPPTPTAAPTSSATVPAATPAPMPAVTITGLQPPSGPVGTTLTVAGSGFTGPGFSVSGVTVGGVPAAFSVISANELQAVVPNVAAGSAPVVVTISNGTTSVSSQPYPFTVTTGSVTNTTPTITGFGPPTANPGDTVVVSGSGFQGGAAVTSVLIDGQTVPFTVISPSEIRITVPAGMAPGPVDVTVVFADGSHSVTQPGVRLTIAGPPSPAPPPADSQTGIGGFVNWLLHPGSAVQVVLEFLSMIIVLGALTLLFVILVWRRRRQEHAPRVVL